MKNNEKVHLKKVEKDKVPLKYSVGGVVHRECMTFNLFQFYF